MKRTTVLLPAWACVLALVAVAATAVCGAEEGRGGDGSPVIGVDAEGNLHINTTSSNATVYVDGQDMKQMIAALASQQAAHTAELSQLRCAARRFSPQKVITSRAATAASVFAADLDGDGDIDVLSASYTDDKIAWYENVDGDGTFSTQRVISTSADAPISVFAADLDGDGDIDVLSASVADDKIAWYENEEGNGTFSAQKIISSNLNNPYSVFAADVDGDGDVDVLSASFADDKIAWYENLDGEGTFSLQKVITIDADGSSSVFAADLDGDGDLDVLSTSELDDKVAWYENEDGEGTFSPQKVITSSAKTARSVFAADVDGDGDLDVLTASFGDNQISWHENVHGNGTFSQPKPITTSAVGARSVSAADLDGDGDMDVLSASFFDSKVAWYENEDGEGTFSPQKVVAAGANGAVSVVAADVDGDGDMDILSALNIGDMIVWYENVCG